MQNHSIAACAPAWHEAIHLNSSRRYRQKHDCVCAGDDSGPDGVGEDHSTEMSALLRESARPTGESSVTVQLLSYYTQVQF